MMQEKHTVQATPNPNPNPNPNQEMMQEKKLSTPSKKVPKLAGESLVQVTLHPQPKP